jgi:hypothetical protein
VANTTSFSLNSASKMVPIVEDALRVTGQFSRVLNVSLVLELNLRTVHPEASPYTDLAIQVHNKRYNDIILTPWSRVLLEKLISFRS